ncbi:nucleotide kinase [Solibacillus sp. R5-41]|uniref:nucleotide kinase n=1 Tax=Solibacillus sp. R5-41 TaxID=2048654 RepID=UPI0020A3F75C|nr:nucleotide kinase [Solibacillus sp. R5-41]
MSGAITHFFGQAMTGQGIKNVYKEVMNEAKTVYLLKGAHGFKISELLQKLGTYYHDKGAEIEYFHDPLFEQSIEATFVKAPFAILFLAATNPVIEPIIIGDRDQVVSLYDCLDEQKVSSNIPMHSITELKQAYYDKCFDSLSKAIHIHDDWEVETRKSMDWNGLNQQYADLTKQLFGENQLEKSAKLTHRLLGTLTPAGARDTVQSITQNLEKRLFIKGYPGTGKSSMMKKIANEALQRGYDVQLVWCGLDSNSIDMVILPELKFCIFDSTEPHVYFPEKNRSGDEIFDIAKHCHPTEVEENNIKEIVAKYKASIAEATRFAKLFADEERKVREAIDAALNIDEFNKRTAKLFQHL